jgi:Mor family transcriptional regulator
MRNMLNYLFSRNKETYREIAKRYQCSVFKVYSLAHGKKARSNKDYGIIQSLIDKGIVSGYRAI